MRTVRFPAGTHPNVAVTGGGSTVQINPDGSGTITYSGTLRLNGAVVRSPQQLLDHWKRQGERAVSVVDRADRLGMEVELELAKGQALAYGHMFDVVHQCQDHGTPPAEIGQALEALRDQVIKKLPAPTSTAQSTGFSEVRLVLAEGASAWQFAARFQWSNDHA